MADTGSGYVYPRWGEILATHAESFRMLVQMRRGQPIPVYTGCEARRVLLFRHQQPEGTKTLTSSAPRLQAAKQATVDDIRAVAESLAKALEDDKAEDLLFIDLQGKSSLADFMIIASGRSGRHVAALADHISQEVKKLTGRPASIEGMPNADWVLIDTGDVIVHLFRPEVREFYNLEKIWAPDAAHMHSRAH